MYIFAEKIPENHEKKQPHIVIRIHVLTVHPWQQ